jgi:hypothetical protein
MGLFDMGMKPYHRALAMLRRPARRHRAVKAGMWTEAKAWQ